MPVAFARRRHARLWQTAGTSAIVVATAASFCRAQLEGSDLEYINSTLCPTGQYFDHTDCACEDVRYNCPNDCNGHGVCDYSTGVCACNDGYGSASDVAEYKALDCSQRSCPVAVAWGGVATSAVSARSKRECAGTGICNRLTGECVCRTGFSGSACELAGCPNECSGNGRCVSNSEVCVEADVAPLDDTAVTYGARAEDVAWDAERIYGCVCDSSWEVGLASGQLQVPEFHGSDCSRRRCPSGDDPVTTEVDETDCEGVNGGAAGNLCYVPCANRGVCDETTGTCTCNVGFGGQACGTRLPSTTRRT
jgi:hypothetical protein